MNCLGMSSSLEGTRKIQQLPAVEDPLNMRKPAVASIFMGWRLSLDGEKVIVRGVLGRATHSQKWNPN